VSIIFEPKLDVSEGLYAPDSYDDATGVLPSDNFIVSRDRNGSPASVFGDLAWNYSAYTPEGRTFRLNFSFWGNVPGTEAQERLSRTTRVALFALIWFRDGTPLSVGTLSNYLSVLNTVAVYADAQHWELGSVLGNHKALIQFVTTQCSGWMAETLSSLLPLLARVGPKHLGFAVVSDKYIQVLKKRNKAYRASIKQHSPIPTRIYSGFIVALQAELAAWQSVAEEMLALAGKCGADHRFGRSTDQQQARDKSMNVRNGFLPTFAQAATPACIDYIQAKNRLPNVRSLSFVITELQIIAKLLIHTFTGMRDEEASSLPYHCLASTVSNGKTHYIVKGWTTKFNNGLPKRTQWVTNLAGANAILAAQAIADVIYAIYNVVPADTVKRLTDHPLFVSVGYLNFAATPMAPVDNRFMHGKLHLTESGTLRDTLFAVIEDADLRELEQIDPHRAWRAEDKFQVGQRWHFTTHQLRRSLALYAQRSGLVSLPSLRRQLQHITEEMSRYYANGSAFAKDFIGDDKTHFGLEWRATEPESAAVSYILNVLLSNDKLFGGHVNWVEHRLKGPDGIILVDRELTMKRFKKGELAYKETLIGGCTSTQDCDQVALKYLNIDCLSGGCKNMVCNLTKLDLVIAAQSRMVGAIDQSTVEYRTEKADLDVLIAARDKALQQSTGATP
jgi:hypothetical protein